MKEIKDKLVNEAIEKLALYCLQNQQLFLHTDFDNTVTDHKGNTHKVYLHFQIEPNAGDNQ